jgi:hypothetical protein
VKDAVASLFNAKSVASFRNAKGAVAEGACAVAASALSLAPPYRVEIEDTNQLRADIGVRTMYNRKEGFVPIAERNAFWWQDRRPVSFIINEPTDKPIVIEMASRDDKNKLRPLDKLVVSGLPKNRPAGTTRLSVGFAFSSGERLTATVRDMGFGEMFPSEGYEEEFAVAL